MKTSELAGALLDYWVAEAEGMLRMISGGIEDKLGGYSPSTKWAQGGPIIEREHFYIEWDADGYWIARHPESITYRAESPLVAAMRAFVASRFGSEVNEVKP